MAGGWTEHEQRKVNQIRVRKNARCCAALLLQRLHVARTSSHQLSLHQPPQERILLVVPTCWDPACWKLARWELAC